MRFFLLLICLSFCLLADNVVNFSDITMGKGKDKTKMFSKNGVLLNENIIISGFPEELSVSSVEAYNISSLCEIENINMTKISKIEVSFKDGYPDVNVKCYNRKDNIFFEKKELSDNIIEVKKYDVNGVLEQRKKINGIYIQYTSFYESGAVLKEGQYVNSKKDGLWKEFYKDGNIKSITNFKKNKIMSIEKF